MDFLQAADELDPRILIIVALAGGVRGITGFGGAMFMAPPLSLLMTPVLAVIYALALETVAAVLMLPSVWRDLDLRTLRLLGLPAMLLIPLGGVFLVNLNTGLIGTLLSVTVMLFAVLLLFDFRYLGEPRPITATLVGGVSGLLFGATSMGGPPVILYLLCGPSGHRVTRANLVAYISFASALSLVVPWLSGEIPAPIALKIVPAVPFYVLGIAAGARAFSFIDERLFRRITLAFMFFVSTLALLL